MFQNIDNEIRQEVKVAAERSKIDPELPVEEVYTNIYHQPPPDFHVRGCDPTINAATLKPVLKERSSLFIESVFGFN